MPPPLFRGEARTWCGARDYYPFAMVVGMERVDATGGASSSPTKSERDSADAKQAERSLKGKGDGDFREIVRM